MKKKLLCLGFILSIAISGKSQFTSYIVKDINVGGSSSGPNSLTAINGVLYFSASDTYTNGPQLWKSDGTSAGTQKLNTIKTPSNFIQVNNMTFFTGGSNATGTWKTDGTIAGTTVVSTTIPFSLLYPQNACVLNGSILFSSNDKTKGTELFTTDGTTIGILKDIDNGAVSSYPSYLVTLNNSVLFAADYGLLGTELWISDGTAGGTVLLKDIAPNTSSSSPSFLTVVGNNVFFIATDGVNGSELWKTDGTANGTVMVKDINPGANSSNIIGLINANGTLYFDADDGVYGRELWKSDGTASGTVMVKDINPGSDPSFPSFPAVCQGMLFFNAYDGSSGTELWKTDGTSAGTVMVKDINPGAGFGEPEFLTNVNDSLYFVADDGVEGKEIWMSDGTTAGTYRVSDIYPGSGNSTPMNLTAMNGKLYFSGNDVNLGNELFSIKKNVVVTITPPVAPTNLTVNPTLLKMTGDKLLLNWTDNSDNETHFKVEGSLNGVSGWASIDSVLTDVTTYTMSGLPPNYTVYFRVYANNSAGSSGYSNVASGTTFTGIDDPFLQPSDVTIYPNPVGEKLNIKVSSEKESEYVLEVFTVLGDAALKKQFSSSGEMQLDVKNLSNGIYFVKISNGTESVQAKIIKE